MLQEPPGAPKSSRSPQELPGAPGAPRSSRSLQEPPEARRSPQESWGTHSPGRCCRALGRGSVFKMCLKMDAFFKIC